MTNQKYDLARRAQAMRAVLLASATATSRAGFFASSALAGIGPTPLIHPSFCIPLMKLGQSLLVCLGEAYREALLVEEVGQPRNKTPKRGHRARTRRMLGQAP